MELPTFKMCQICLKTMYAISAFQEVGGMMSLTDVYCRVNRARGLELLSPEDLLNACNMLEKLNLPIRLHTFDSGVKVLQLQSHSDSVVVDRTLEVVSYNYEFCIISTLVINILRQRNCCCITPLVA